MIGIIIYKGCWKKQNVSVIINKQEMLKVSLWLNVNEELGCWGCEPVEEEMMEAERS